MMTNEFQVLQPRGYRPLTEQELQATMALVDGMSPDQQLALDDHLQRLPIWRKASSRILQLNAGMLDINGLAQMVRSINDGKRQDANETFFAQHELEQVQRTFYATTYPELKAAIHVPAADDALMLGADTYTIFGYQGTGKTRMLRHGTEQIPLVSALLKEQTVKVHYFACGFEISLLQRWADMFSASGAGGRRIAKPFTYERAGIETARMTVDFDTDFLLSFGNAEYGITGFLTLPITGSTPVNEITLDNGSWDDTGTTADEILDDFAKMWNQFWVDSGYRYHMTNLLLPTAAFTRLNKRLDGTDKTIMSFVKENYPELVVEEWYRCNDYDNIPGATQPRAIAYYKASRVVRHHSLVAPELLPPFQASSRSWQIDVINGTGGVTASDLGGLAYAKNTTKAP